MGDAGITRAPQIAKLLKDTNRNVQLDALHAMRKMEKPIEDYTDVFVELLKSNDDILRIRASETLAMAGASASAHIPQITELLVSNNSKFRAIAAYTLGKLGEHAKPALPKLEELLNNKNPVIRSSSLKVMAKMGPNAKDQINNIIALLADQDRDVRGDAVFALGSIGSLNEDQLAKVASMLDDEDRKVRYKAVLAIGEIGTPASKYAPKVAGLLKDPDELVNKSAANVLAKLGPDAAGESENLGQYIKNLSNDQVANRAQIVVALETMSEMGNAASDQGAIVAELLSGPNNGVRSNALYALERMSPLDSNTVLMILASTYKLPSDTNKLRVLAHQAAGGNEKSEILISWLGKSGKETVSGVDTKDSNQSLNVLLESWEFATSREEMREELVAAIVEVSNNGKWSKDDIEILTKAQNTLSSNGYNEQAEVVATQVSKLGG